MKVDLRSIAKNAIGTAVLSMIVLAGASIPAQAECNELGIAAYSAVQDVDTVTVFANGIHRTGGFENCLVLGPEDVVPPIYEFKIKRPAGGSIQQITPFTVHAEFGSKAAIDHVTVRDVRGDHKVAVVQLAEGGRRISKRDGLCKVVAEGTVGEPGAVSMIHHQVTGNREVVMVVRNIKSSLCGNTGAVAMLIVNGKPVSHGDITQLKSSIQTSAKPGDQVFALVHTVELFNDITCIRLGDLKLTLEQCDLE